MRLAWGRGDSHHRVRLLIQFFQKAGGEGRVDGYPEKKKDSISPRVVNLQMSRPGVLTGRGCGDASRLVLMTRGWVVHVCISKL